MALSKMSGARGRVKYARNNPPRLHGNEEELERKFKEMELMKQPKIHIPPNSVAEVSLEGIAPLLTCYRCEDILDPALVFACEEEIHYTCVNCFLALPAGNKDEKSTEEEEGCCDNRHKLHHLPPYRTYDIKFFLDIATFRCVNHEKGCSEEMDGLDNYLEHKKNCPFTVPFKCRHYECAETRGSVEDLVKHYEEDHDAGVLSGERFTLPIDFNETTKGRLCAILKVNARHFVFACEVKDGILHAWIWSLENEATGIGTKTAVWYRLKFKRVRDVAGMSNSKELHEYRSRCLFHTVEPSEIMSRELTLCVDSYKLDLTIFEKLFVQQTVSGDGKWTVSVCIEQGNQK